MKTAMPRRMALLLLLECFLVPGCGRTVPVRGVVPTDNDHVFNFDQVNAQLEWATAVINCNNGKAYVARNIRTNPDTTYFSDDETGVRYSLGARRLLSIEVKDHLGVVLTGALAGMLAGFG